VTGSVLFIVAEKYSTRLNVLTVGRGLVVGCFQALALLPGMSRSGMSISGGLLMGLTREEATRFAFLLSAPIIFGAGGKELFSLYSEGVLSADPAPLIVAVVAAFLSGLISIRFMLRFLRTRTLIPFVWYRLALAALIVVVVLV
jgi:undecaprenyl-diphosphatase